MKTHPSQSSQHKTPHSSKAAKPPLPTCSPAHGSAAIPGSQTQSHTPSHRTYQAQTQTKTINNNKLIIKPKLRTSTIQFIHVLDGEGEAGERLPGCRRRLLREGEDLEPLDEGAKVCSDDRGVVTPFEPPPGLGEDQDAGDGDADDDPDLGGGEIELRRHFQG